MENLYVPAPFSDGEDLDLKNNRLKKNGYRKSKRQIEMGTPSIFRHYPG
ncbi:MAG: hypothetical protein WAU64_03105 [Methanoregula sp.]